MTKMKKSLALILTLMLVFTLAACAAETPPSPAPPPAPEATPAPPQASPAPPDANRAGGFVYGVALQTFDGAFHLAQLAGIEAAVEAIDPEGTVIALGADKRADLQVEQVEDLISRGVDIILVNPVDSGAIRTALLSAEAAGIPVVNLDSPVDNQELVISLVQSDNYRAGEVGARAIVEVLGGSGNVAVLNHPSVQACLIRANAFYDVIANYPDINVVADLNFGGHSDTAQNMIETILMAFPDLAAVFTIADVGAYGAVAAARANGYSPGDILITGVDGEQAAIDLVAEGWMLGTAWQDSHGIGWTGVEIAFAFLTGQPFDAIVYIDVLFIDESLAATHVGH